MCLPIKQRDRCVCKPQTPRRMILIFIPGLPENPQWGRRCLWSTHLDPFRPVWYVWVCFRPAASALLNPVPAAGARLLCRGPISGPTSPSAGSSTQLIQLARLKTRQMPSVYFLTWHAHTCQDFIFFFFMVNRRLVPFLAVLENSAEIKCTSSHFCHDFCESPRSKMPFSLEQA